MRIPKNIRISGLSLDQGEFKSVDVAGAYTANTTGAIQLLNGIARGDDINERIGRQVILKSIEMHVVNYVTPTTGIDQTQRILVVYDSQTNATALTILQVLNFVTTISLKNLENRKRFSILLDKLINLNASGESGSKVCWKWYKKLNHETTFNNGDAATVADITTGSLYLISIGSEAAGATAGGTEMQCRIRYTDK